MKRRMMEEQNAACVATRLTPQGRGAVAVISVEGWSASELVGKHFVSAAGKQLTSFPVNRVIFGRWKQTDGNGEEIVVCRTSKTALEVNCHGGVAAAGAIISALARDGAIEQSPEVWASSHSSDSIESEAWIALAEARTERAAAILLDQFRGALRQAIESAIHELKRGDKMAAGQRLESLLERGDIGLHLTKPWRVAFAGPPNVGKSSLVNCLLGYQRSIVFDQPGTTRDLLSAPTAFDGWLMELIDTAGLRESEDVIEAEGVSRATTILAEADLTVLVFDATCDWDAQQEQLLAENPNTLRVINKCDVRNATDANTDFLATSALTGDGVPELMQQIVKRLVRRELTPGDPVPFTRRQVRAIDSVRRAIDSEPISTSIKELQSLVAGEEPTSSPEPSLR
jgi:tRNA modification GTPase